MTLGSKRYPPEENQHVPENKPFDPKGKDHLPTAYTLPETNMAPENAPLEKEIPIGNHHFWVLC